MSDHRTVTLTLTPRQAHRLRMLLVGEISRPNIEETHRRTWREIVARLERGKQK